MSNKIPNIELNSWKSANRKVFHEGVPFKRSYSVLRETLIIQTKI